MLATYHCVLLPETLLSLSASSKATLARGSPRANGRTPDVLFRSPNLTLLTQRWQDRCLEIREACRTLLLSELRRIGTQGRRDEIDRCVIYLPNYTQGTAQQPPVAQQQQTQLADAEMLSQLDDSDMRVGMLFHCIQNVFTWVLCRAVVLKLFLISVIRCDTRKG